ncbi:MAG: hypothetical protein JNM52_05680, partial [Betaproteobacteria bacterium]|nr:hypothetical protein [Betaproteobacteria bacterium]
MPLAASAESIPQPSAESTQSIPKPAAAPVQPVTEVFFAQTVTDPYRYMEDVSAPEVEAYMRAQSGYARSTLDAIPGRAALAQRIDALSQTGIAVSGVQVVGVGAGVGGNARLFYYQLAPGDKSRKLYVREGFKGRERLLFDVQSLTATPPAKPGAAPTRWSLDYFLAAPDGRHVLVGVAAGGSENTVLRVIEVASGRDLGIVIDRIGFTQSTAWANDGKTFFYNRLPDVGGGDAKNRYLYSRVYRHQLGRPLSRDELVLGPGMRVEAKAGAKPTEIPFYDIDIPSVAMSADGSFLVGQVKRGDMRDVSVYVAPATDLPKGPRWRKLVDFTDQVTSYVADDKTLFVISHKDAPRNKVLRVSLSEPNLAKATVVLPQGDTVVEELALARDALYI